MVSGRDRATVTIYEVAARAGVSISTVSQTLNRPNRVNAATREKVLGAISELGYVPKLAAISHARRGVGRIGVLAPFSSYESYGRRLTGVLKESEGKDRDVVVYDQPSAAAVAAPILQSLPVTGRLDGLLIMGTPVNDSLVSELARLRTPAVLIDSGRPDLSSVNVDDRAGAVLAGQHLVARGHRSFAWIHEEQISRDYLSAAQRRLAGLIEAVESAGLPSKSVREITTVNSVQGGRQALEAVLELKKRPTAIFAHHDQLAAGVLSAARHHGLRVPEDLAVIGYDDGPLAEALGLTTMRQPFEETGRLGTALLAQQIEDQSLPHQRILLNPSLVVRDTT